MLDCCNITRFFPLKGKKIARTSFGRQENKYRFICHHCFSRRIPMEAALQGPAGRTALGTGVVTLGRAPDNQLVINDSKASSHHAEISQASDGQGYSITDLGSTNGTFVNEQHIDQNVARSLHVGDTVRIGDTTFTYEVSGASQVAPTIYATPGQGNTPGYQPTVAAAPPSFADYGANVQPQQAYQPTPPADTPYPPPPQQPYPPPQTPPYAPLVYAQPGIPGYAPPPQPRKKSRRGLLITLAVILAVLVVACGAIVIVGRSTPSKTLDAFCSAIKSQDYQTAYNQLSQFRQTRIKEQEFASLFSHFSSCTYTAITESVPQATAPMTFFGTAGGSLNGQADLIQ